MHRRAYWRALVAAGMGPLAGCGVFEATTEEDDPAAAREEQVAAANDHLKQIFDTLAGYDIVAGGRPVVDPDAYTSEDLGVLRQELDGVDGGCGTGRAGQGGRDAGAVQRGGSWRDAVGERPSRDVRASSRVGGSGPGRTRGAR
jgi:hypothetical protein